ncbi:MAG: 50S ribosomal protein L10 [Dehalococcoidia bacterium]
MPTPSKEEEVKLIADRLSRCTIAIATDYRGLTTAEMNLLRTRLREKGVEYRVIKNSLARRAAEQLGKESLSGFLEGPTALAFGYDDISEPAKALVSHIRSERSVLSIKGGLLDGNPLAADQVNTLATLPPKEQLIAQSLGALKMPLYALHYALSAQLQGLVTVLNARVATLEGE